MDCIIDGIAVRGADSEAEAREAVQGAHAGTKCIEIRHGEVGTVAVDYRRVPFERIRRITGYLSSTERFNEAKTAELRDRVKHRVG